MKITVTTLVSVLIIALLFAFAPSILSNLRYDDFSISGAVTDENGTSLDDVVVRALGGRHKDEGMTTEYEDKSGRVDGRFNYEFNNVSVVRLSFHKEGFTGPLLQWTKGGKYTNVQVVMKRAQPASQPTRSP